MKKLPVVLFFSGLAIQLAALLGEHAAEIPFVLKIVAPAYCRAQAGIDTLMKKRSLVNTDEGFKEISHLLLWNMYEINNVPKNQNYDFKVDSISCMGAPTYEGTAHGTETYTSDDIRYTLSTVTNRFTDSGGHIFHSFEFHYHLAALREKVGELKTPNVLWFCFGWFLIGSMVEVFAFLWEHADTKEVDAIVNKYKDQPPESSQTEEQEKPSG